MLIFIAQESHDLKYIKMRVKPQQIYLIATIFQMLGKEHLKGAYMYNDYVCIVQFAFAIKIFIEQFKK